MTMVPLQEGSSSVTAIVGETSDTVQITVSGNYGGQKLRKIVNKCSFIQVESVERIILKNFMKTK